MFVSKLNETIMTMPVSLVKVGNSNAIIIPSKILKQMGLKENTKFELTLESDSLIQIRKVSSRLDPVFPKIKIPKVTTQDMKLFFDDLMVIGSSERNEDERLAYILER